MNQTMQSHNASKPQRYQIEAAKQLSIVTVYVLLGLVNYHYFTGAIWPGSGLALATVLIGGRRYLWSILCASLIQVPILFHLPFDDSILFNGGIAAAKVAEAFLGIWLLNYHQQFTPLQTLRDYLWLILLGGTVACFVGANISVFALLLAGLTTPANYVETVQLWWSGDTLGVILVAPLILTWWHMKSVRISYEKWLEMVLLIGSTFVIGQIVFLGWFNDIFGVGAKGFLMFLPITLIAIRLDMRAVTFSLNMIAVQALSGAYLQVGYFAHEGANLNLKHYWLYVVTLSVVGMALTIYVNERQQIEHALNASEERFRMLFTQSPVGIGLIDSITGTIYQVNQKYADIVGFTIDEIKHMDWMQITHPDDIQADLDKMALMNTGEVNEFTLEKRLIHANKSIIWIHLTVARMNLQKHGNPCHHCVIEDITERKKIEASLLESEFRWKFAIEGCGDGVWDWNVQTNEALYSKQWKEMLGYTEQDILPTNDEWVIRIHPDDREYVTETMQAYLQGKTESYVAEYRLRCKNNDYKWILGRGMIVQCDDNGEPTRLIGTHTDMTERKESEDNLAKSKSEFVANISHEIRTPMNAIIGISRLALKKEISSEVENYLKMIYSASSDLLNVINDILDFSKLEAMGFSVDTNVFDLDVILANLDNLFITLADETNVAFKMILAPDVPRRLVGDATKLQQVLTNLLSNAKKFTAQGEVIMIVTFQNQVEDRVDLCFTVCDTGIGMTTEQRDKLFKPFSQADTSITRQYGGTGLGLAICKQLVELMGGEIRVTSVYGEGSTFVFNVPLTIAPPVEFKTTEILPCPISNYHAQRILLVEDNDINQVVAMELLTSMGLHVQIASNGKEAVAIASAEPFDLILMDVQMPVMDGLTATRLIRENLELKDVPIIAMTAHAMQGDKEKSLAAGMNDHLTKPIEIDKLTTTLNHWLKIDEIKMTTPIKVLPKELPPFALADALERINQNAVLLHRLLILFHDKYAEAETQLRQWIEVSNFTEAYDLVHSIKGVAGTLSATELATAAAAFELALDSEQLDKIRSSLDDFTAALNVALVATASLL
jgi:PAS domain S-box-containing protein